MSTLRILSIPEPQLFVREATTPEDLTQIKTPFYLTRSFLVPTRLENAVNGLGLWTSLDGEGVYKYPETLSAREHLIDLSPRVIHFNSVIYEKIRVARGELRYLAISPPIDLLESNSPTDYIAGTDGAKRYASAIGILGRDFKQAKKENMVRPFAAENEQIRFSLYLLDEINRLKQ